MAAITDTLQQQMVDDLARSGLVLDDVFGAQSVGPEEMLPLPGVRDMDLPALEDEEGYDPDDDTEVDLVADKEAEGGYTIPYFTLFGDPVMDGGKQFRRVRLIGPKNKDVPRYRSPKGSGNHVYIPQGLRDLLARITRQRKILLDVDVLYITEGEKKAICAVKSGILCVALPGVSMWSDSPKVRKMKNDYAASGGDQKDIRMAEDTPVNPELLRAIEQIQALCPSIGIVCVLYDSGGKPIPYKLAYQKTKGGLVPVGGIAWETCDVPQSTASFVSENPLVSRAGFTLSAALRKQMTTRAVVATRFCEWNKDNDAWAEQGLDDWLQAERFPQQVQKELHGGLENALRLWDVVSDEPLFSCAANPDALGSKGGPSAEIAFSRLLDGTIVGQADGLLYEWVGSHWQMVDQRRLERAAHILMDFFYAETGTSRKIADAPRAAVSAPHLRKIPKVREWAVVGGAIIPCADVTLDIAPDGAITPREPSKDDGLRYAINAAWADRDKPSPEFDRFVQATLPDPDVRRIVQQYIGYTLISDTRYQVAQWWFGSGSNGKGFLAGIVAALHRKVAAADIEDLGGFGAENLIDASLITVDETPRRIDEQRLKSAISGDDLSINRKYHVPVTVRLHAKWLLRGNDKPALSDQSDGLWRRLQIVEFTQKFDGADRDDMLASRIISNELAGVMRWAIDGLVSLLQAGGFQGVPAAMQAAKYGMQVLTDNVLGWWAEQEVQICDSPCTNKDTIYQDYADWCRTNGMLPLGMPRFWSRVMSIVERYHGPEKLPEARPWVSTTNAFNGQIESKRVRKIGLKIGPDKDAENASGETTADKAADKTPPPLAPDAAVTSFTPTGGFAELEEDILF